MSNVIKKSLQTTIFTTALAAASLSPSSAYTTSSDVTELDPTGPWAVSRAGAQSASPYCTLSKRYDKDIILTMAESSSQSLTFAIDFQADRFKKETTYNLVLATDNGDSRSYEVSPATDKAFILRIKDDPEFYNNLWKSGSANLSVDAENYRFNTADFMGGRTDISSCLASLEELKPRRSEEASKLVSNVKNVPISTVSTMEARSAANLSDGAPAETLSQTPAMKTPGFETQRLGQISKIANELESLKQENYGLKEALKRERESYEAKMANMRRDTSSSMEMAEKIALLEKQNEQLRIDIQKKAEAPAPAAPEVVTSLDKTLFGELERLRSENALLKTSLDASLTAQEAQIENDNNISVDLREYEGFKQQNELMASKIKALEVENNKLQELNAQIASAPVPSPAEDSMLVSSLRSENRSLTEELRQKTEKLNEIQSALDLAYVKIEEYEKVKEEVVSLRTENESLIQSYAALETAAGEVTPSGADNEMSAWQRRYNEQKLEMERMAAQMEAERQAFEKEKRDIENMLFDPAVTNKAQLEHLARLEQELQIANKALKEQRQLYEGGGSVGASANTQDSILPSPSRVIGTGRSQISMMDMSQEIQRLRQEIDRLRRAPSANRITKLEYEEKDIVLTSPSPKADPVVVPPVTVKPEEDEVVPPIAIAEDVVASEESIPAIEITEKLSGPEVNVQQISMKPEPVEIIEAVEPPAQITEDIHIEKTSVSEKQVTETAQSYVLNPLANQKKWFQALPDEDVWNKLQTSDKSAKITSKQSGTVFWKSDVVEGTLMRKHLQGAAFEASVDGMIDNLKRKCPAILDVEPLLLRKSKAGNLFAYDADCGATTIGLVFFSKDGQTLSTVSYGAPKEAKEDLDLKREKLIDALMSSMQS